MSMNHCMWFYVVPTDLTWFLFFNVSTVWHVYSALYVRYTHIESRYSVCVCAITRLAALRRLIQPHFLGGDPYGRSQSVVDGITATLVLMRSSLALMSDRMTGRGGPHGSQPGRESDRHKHTVHIHTITAYTHIQKYTFRKVSFTMQDSNIF